MEPEDTDDFYSASSSSFQAGTQRGDFSEPAVEGMYWTLPRSSYWPAGSVHRLTKSEAPWVFEKEEPFRVVAFLELLGVLFAVVFFMPKSDDPSTSRRTAEFSVVTDDQGNGGHTRKWTTTKYALYLCAVEFADQLGDRQLSFDLRWRSRDVNVEADVVTNDDSSVFNLVLRLSTEGIWKHLICLPSLAVAAESFEEQVAAAKTSKLRAVKDVRLIINQLRLRARKLW